MEYKEIEVSFHSDKVRWLFIKVKVEKIQVCSGHDCWGRYEYDDVYVVTNEDGKVLYRGEEDPTKLVDELTKDT